MSGQLLKAVAKDPVAKHTHVTLTFTPAGQLRFVDPRTFGEMFVSDPDHLAEDAPELADLGFDPARRADLLDRLRSHAASRSPCS